MAPFIHRSVANHVATVGLSRPDLHNAFNEVVIAELTAAFEELGKNKDVRVIVLRGEGKSFCAGADVNWMSRMVGYSLDENIADASMMARMLRVIRDCPKPTIVRVHGAAIGGGVGLTAACDIAVALSSAMFCLSEVKLGIIPAVISPFVMEKIGPGHLRRYALTAERFGAAEAKRIGLVHEVVQTEPELDDKIDALAHALIANGPAALAAAKRTLTDVAGMQWDAVQKLTTRRIAEIRVSPEGQEGLKAFLEKREPRWTDKR
jgi:methylglutaconyl-CoA hydratase